MELIHFFEQLATHPHHKINIDQLLIELPTELKNAFYANDSESIKKQLGNEYLANESHVTDFAL